MKKFNFIAVILAIAIVAFLGCALAWFFGNLGVYAEMISIFRDLIVALAAVVGACVAVLGLDEWKRQFNAKNEYEMARRILKAVHKLRDAIHWFRDGFISDLEMNAAYEEAKKLGKIPHDSYIAAYDARFMQLQEAVRALLIERQEAEVIWGEENITCLLDKFLKLVRQLDWWYLRVYRRHCIKGDRSDELLPKEEEHMAKCLKTIMGGKEDDVGKEVTQMVAEIEKHLRPKLNLRGSPR